MESRQPLNTEDETFRKLARRPWDEVYAAMVERVFAVSPGHLDPEVTKSVLREHGWTGEEFIDELLNHAPNFNNLL